MNYVFNLSNHFKKIFSNEKINNIKRCKNYKLTTKNKMFKNLIFKTKHISYMNKVNF